MGIIYLLYYFLELVLYLLKRRNLIKEEKKVVTLYGSEGRADFRS